MYLYSTPPSISQCYLVSTPSGPTEAEPSPSPTPSPKSSETTQPNPEAHKIMPESVAKDIIHIFPHKTSDLVLDITPLTFVPPPFVPKLTISSKPIISSQPRSTTSAPSSPMKEAKEGNLIPRRRRTAMDDIRVIRRTPQQRESSKGQSKNCSSYLWR